MQRKSKSTKSTRSLQSIKSSVCAEYRDLGQAIVDALKQYECPIDIIVNKITEKTTKKLNPLKAESGASSTYMSNTERDTNEADAGSILTVDTFYDINDRLVEISIRKYKSQVIPRLVIQVLGLLIHNYAKLTKFIINDSFADRYTIVELKNILAVSTTITDICLDKTFSYEGNYDVLLIQVTSLRNLSLKSCNINDDVCQRIANRLHFLQPAETTLLTLNLSSNRITDSGAASLGEALRSNRHLRYLNLADNQITDYGATFIFDSLKEFPLTYEEIICKRKMYYQYLKNKTAIYTRLILEFNSKPADIIPVDKKKITKLALKHRRSRNSEQKSFTLNESFDDAKMELLASSFVGPFDHPFNISNVTIKDSSSYCKGNFVLCYLNLAYNDLTYSSIQKLLKLLEYQDQDIQKSIDFTGLLRVIIEGNNLASSCIELERIANILNTAVNCKSSMTGTKKK